MARDISVGGNADRSLLVTGDGNIVMRIARQDLPDPTGVDIRKELADLEAQLAAIPQANRDLLAAALAEAKAHVNEPNPAKDAVGSALERALKYAGSTEKLVEHGEKIWPTLRAVGSWLGEYGPKVLRIAGMAII